MSKYQNVKVQSVASARVSTRRKAAQVSIDDATRANVQEFADAVHGVGGTGPANAICYIRKDGSTLYQSRQEANLAAKALSKAMQVLGVKDVTLTAVSAPNPKGGSPLGLLFGYTPSKRGASLYNPAIL